MTIVASDAEWNVRYCSLLCLRRVSRGVGDRARVAPRRAVGDWRTRTVEYLGCAPTSARLVVVPVVEGSAIPDGRRLALAHRACGPLSRRRSWRRLLSTGRLACAGFGSGRPMVRPCDDRWCGIHRTSRQEGDSLILELFGPLNVLTERTLRWRCPQSNAEPVRAGRSV